MLFLVVNFHYIEEEGTYPFEGIYGVSPKKFSAQLDELGKRFSFVSQKELREAILGKKELPERCCLITFDDGLRGQYENGLPILEKKGIPAIFFINTLPYQERKACLVHKIHWLRAHLGAEDFLAHLNDGLKALTGKTLAQAIVSLGTVKGKYFYDKPEVAKLKFFLNYILLNQHQDLKEKLIDGLFNKLVGSEADFCKSFYIKKTHLPALARSGSLGLHTHSHFSPQKFSTAEFKNDIIKNYKCLRELVGKSAPLKGISYPFGDSTELPATIVNFLRLLGLEFGFTMKRSFNRTLDAPFFLARMDTNDVIGGKCPTFTFWHNKIKMQKIL